MKRLLVTYSEMNPDEATAAHFCGRLRRDGYDVVKGSLGCNLEEEVEKADRVIMLCPDGCFSMQNDDSRNTWPVADRKMISGMEPEKIIPVLFGEEAETSNLPDCIPAANAVVFREGWVIEDYRRLLSVLRGEPPAPVSETLLEKAERDPAELLREISRRRTGISKFTADEQQAFRRRSFEEIRDLMEARTAELDRRDDVIGEMKIHSDDLFTCTGSVFGSRYGPPIHSVNVRLNPVPGGIMGDIFYEGELCAAAPTIDDFSTPSHGGFHLVSENGSMCFRPDAVAATGFIRPELPADRGLTAAEAGEFIWNSLLILLSHENEELAL